MGLEQESTKARKFKGKSDTMSDCMVSGKSDSCVFAYLSFCGLNLNFNGIEVMLFPSKFIFVLFYCE